MIRITRLVAAAAVSLLLSSAALVPSALAAQCGGDFNAFLATMSREAQAQGVSRAVIDQAFAGVTQDQGVLSFDRRQRGTFRKSFEEYVATRVALGDHRCLERRAGRQVGEELAAVLAGDAVLEHRHRRAAHRAVEAVVEDDGQDRQLVHVRPDARRADPILRAQSSEAR